MLINNRIEGNKYPQIYMPIRRRLRAPNVLRAVFSVLSVLTIPKIVILGIVLTQKNEYPFSAYTNGFN